MAYNHGQDIAVNEWKMTIHALTQRILWSLGISVCVLVTLVFFGPSGMILNLTKYAGASLNLRLHETLPLTGGVTRQHIHDVAKYWALMVHQARLWGLYLMAAAGVFLISLTLFTFYFWHKGKREKIDKVMRGAQLVTPGLHNAVMKRTYGKSPPNEMGRALKLGKEGITVPESVQYLHFAFAGAAGGGKSTAIAEVIEQAIGRGDKGLVVDLGGAFFSKFGRTGDHVLSLRDPRSEAWDFWHEDGIPEEAMAAAMIEEDTMGNTYFWKGARAVLAALLRRTSSTAELWEDFKKPTKALREKLADADEISRRVMGDNDSDQADGIIGTTVLDFPFLKELNQWAEGREPFSVARWINDHNDASWTYILVTEADLEIAKPLLRVWFDIACLATLQRDPDDQSNRHTWLILDEIKTLGKLHSLPSILDKGRKFKTSVVLGFQAMSQFEKVYGGEDTKSILQGVQNQFLFRMTEAASANYVSELLGEQDVEQTSFGVSFGSEKAGDRGSFNRNLVRKRLVMPEDVRGLETLQAFVRMARHQPFKMSFAVPDRPRRWPLAVSKQRAGYRQLAVTPKASVGTFQSDTVRQSSDIASPDDALAFLNLEPQS